MYARIAAHPLYDALMRLPLLAYAVLVCAAQLAGILALLRQPLDATLAVNLAAGIAGFSFIFSYALLAVCRSRPLQRAAGLGPRISALLGSFLSTAFVLFPRHELSLAAGLLSTSLLLVGHALSLFVILRLGRSFSIMPEARQLVTSGIYRLVRHPLYLAEEIAIFGIFIQFASFWTTLLLAGQIAFQWRRMKNEEAILAATFPEYRAYRLRTARLVPTIY
jgi:protein-S-isoprenylcysteine O-methyltransferase Ste14